MQQSIEQGQTQSEVVKPLTLAELEWVSGGGVGSGGTGGGPIAGVGGGGTGGGPTAGSAFA